MTTATPLSLPFVLQQSDRPTSSQISRRRWKPDRPNYRALLSAHHSAVSTDGASTSAPSRFQTAVKPASSQQDSDQLEADLEEWGLPSAHTSASTSTLPRLAAPVSAISWDENSALSSSSHFESQQSAALTPFASLNQWDPSISFAPYVSSGLRQVELPTSEIGSDATNSLPLKYNPGLGRVFAVGREDGTVSVYRAYGRTRTTKRYLTQTRQRAMPMNQCQPRPQPLQTYRTQVWLLAAVTLLCCAVQKRKLRCLGCHR